MSPYQVFSTVYRCDRWLPFAGSFLCVMEINPLSSRFLSAISTVGTDIEHFSAMFFLEGNDFFKKD